jgi:glycosyltransferase involved in cell wall biosynthesis
MRVLVLTHSYSGNGAAVCLQGVMRHWVRDLGWQVDALCENSAVSGTADEEEIRACGATPVREPLNAPYQFALINTVVTIERFAHVMQQLPTLLWVHEGQTLLSNSTLSREAWTQIFQAARLSIFQSPWQTEQLFAPYLAAVPKERYCAIPNGITDSTTLSAEAAHKERRQLRRQALAAGQAARVVQSGLLSPLKRPQDVWAACLWLSQTQSLQLHYLGSDAPMPLLAQADASQNSPSSRAFHQAWAQAQPTGSSATRRWQQGGLEVFFHGALRHAQALEQLSSCDVLVSGSSDETQGLTPLEAGLLGLPVALTDLPCYAGIWRHGHNALLAPVGDVPLLGWHLKALTNDTALAHRLGQAAHATALHFSWADFLARFDAAVFEALGLKRWA